MTSLKNIVVAVGTVALLTGCMHRGSTAGLSSGDVAVDSLSASRTAILRVDNSYPEDVRVYTVIGGQKNYVAKALAGQVRTWVLDPQLFPAQSISFEADARDGAMKQVLGPFKVQRGETVELVVTPQFESSRVSIHPSTR